MSLSFVLRPIHSETFVFSLYIYIFISTVLRISMACFLFSSAIFKTTLNPWRILPLATRANACYSYYWTPCSTVTVILLLLLVLHLLPVPQLLLLLQSKIWLLYYFSFIVTDTGCNSIHSCPNRKCYWISTAILITSQRENGYIWCLM